MGTKEVDKFKPTVATTLCTVVLNSSGITCANSKKNDLENGVTSLNGLFLGRNAHENVHGIQKQPLLFDEAISES